MIGHLKEDDGKLMKKILTLLSMMLLLSSCSLFRVHKMDIEQGNIMTPDMLAQIHTGMSESQVKSILGTPMLTNTFTNDRIDYIYSYKPGYGQVNIKSETLIFRNGRLQSIQGNMYSAYMK